ncbi:MAG: protein kinase [Kiritimatiellae bacterium]|nr:protein kinase [Kiritimatiellia bacterium]
MARAVSSDNDSSRKRETSDHLDTAGRIPDCETIAAYLDREGLRRGVALTGGGTHRKRFTLRTRGGSRYEIGAEIARGGMGILYEALDLNAHRVVALKVLPRELPEPRKDLLRFIREGQLTSQLEHPNIVPVHEMGLDEDGHIYYTMKYVQGRTLTNVLVGLRKGEPAAIDAFPLARLLNIFQKVCDAVAFAHSRGVIHRDLKPDNIMIGDYGEVLVVDWGLAKILEQAWAEEEEGVEPGRPSAPGRPGKVRPKRQGIGPLPTDDFGETLKTISGRIMGTPGFMSPEQVFTGEVEITERSDIYSLGAILYSMLTLRPTVIVQDEDVKEVLGQIVYGDIPAPAEFNEAGEGDAGSAGATRAGSARRGPFPHCPDGWIPTALSDIAMHALATQPAERHSTVQDLQREVEDYQNGYVWHVVLDDDFSDSDVAARWDIHGGPFEVRKGELRLHSGEPEVMILRRDVPGDVRIEFECRIESDYLNCIACFMNAFRADNYRDTPWSGYEFEFGGYDNSRNVLHRFNEQYWIEPAAPLKKGEAYHVVAERFGPRLRLCVNGREIVSMTDPNPLSGGDRVAVGVLSWLSDVRYARIKISALGTPWKSDVLDVAERQIQKGRYAVAMGLFEDILQSFPDAERRARAEAGLALAQQRYSLTKNLPGWNARLRQAWPGRNVELLMVNDGLSLDISFQDIRDLSPLKGLPLNVLYCAQCGIESLEPLRGMPLTALNCLGNPITDLAPLAGMPLKALLCQDCPISSLEPLRGMPLRMLRIGMNNVKDLEPLRGMPLTYLDCWSCAIEDLEPLRGMALDNLNCAGNRIRSLEPLRGMCLTNLHCSGNRIADLIPLCGMPLKVLTCGDNEIADLAPLADLPLTTLVCSSNRVTDLSPLKDLSLAVLACGDNPLTGLGPFVASPPAEFLFNCDTIPDAELERIRKAWAKRSELAQRVKDIEVIRAFRARDVNRMRKLAGEYKGHRYLFVPVFARWAEARALCEELGGHLLTVTNEGEDEFIRSLFKTGGRFWMGLCTRADGTSEWVTGEPFKYMNFLRELHERIQGPKLFSRLWCHDHARDPHNCFMVEWES